MSVVGDKKSKYEETKELASGDVLISDISVKNRESDVLKLDQINQKHCRHQEPVLETCIVVLLQGFWKLNVLRYLGKQLDADVEKEGKLHPGSTMHVLFFHLE